MASPALEDLWSPALQRAVRTILVVDVVESVRLIEANEEDTVQRWQAFVSEVERELLPARGGRLVKSLGDGLMLEFDQVPAAVQAAFEMQRRIEHVNTGRDASRALRLRMGLHHGSVLLGEHDVYGTGVNLAARLVTLAQPGDVVASIEARDALVPDLDADVEDLGLCHLKHVERPVRAYRLRPGGSLPAVLRPGRVWQDTRPVLAVLPLESLVTHTGASPQVLGEAISDCLIGALARSTHVHVVSGLSSRAVAGRALPLGEMGQLLGAQFLLRGRCVGSPDGMRVWVELSDVRDERVVWTGYARARLDEFLMSNAPLAELVAEVLAALWDHELSRARRAPIPSLEAYALLLGAVGLMHRASREDFERSLELLDHLAERQPRLATPHAWLGKWHVLKVVQGWSLTPQEDAARASEHVERALDLEPDNALALAMGALVQGYLHKSLDRAAGYCQAALTANPNESLAWLFQGILQAWREQGAQASASALQALRLSPLDPLRYFYDSLTATALLSNQEYEAAVAHARASLKANRYHASTLRTLVMAQMLGGHADEARASAKWLLEVEPQLTVDRFLQRYPGADRPHAQRYAEALREAGVPAG